MKEEFIQSLSVVLNALENIEVKGKSNLANLSGSIAMIENILTAIGSVEIVKKGAEFSGDTEEK